MLHCAENRGRSFCGPQDAPSNARSADSRSMPAGSSKYEMGTPSQISGERRSQNRPGARKQKIPQLGGLHHRYERVAA